jgi:hypothetical protein
VNRNIQGNSENSKLQLNMFDTLAPFQIKYNNWHKDEYFLPPKLAL